MKIACLMMQKDEVSLLDTWITYHGHLFGFDNLFVFDNGSKDKVIDTIFQKHGLNGVSIVKNFSSKADFYNKGQILGEYIKFLDLTAGYDFVVPLDCDEFLAVESETGEILFDIKSIEAELRKYEQTESPLAIKGSYFNIPRLHDMFFFYPEFKIFFKSKTFEFMDEGFHIGRTKVSSDSIKTNLVHFHFLNKPFALGKRHAEEKLAGLVSDFSKENMLNYEGSGSHLKRFFVQTEEEYDNFLAAAGTFLPNFKVRLSEIGLRMPFSEYWETSSEVRILEQQQGL
jgi:hypothetical protein